MENFGEEVAWAETRRRRARKVAMMYQQHILADFCRYDIRFLGTFALLRFSTCADVLVLHVETAQATP
jgi:hypothetical protein